MLKPKATFFHSTPTLAKILGVLFEEDPWCVCRKKDKPMLGLDWAVFYVPANTV